MKRVVLIPLVILATYCAGGRGTAPVSVPGHGAISISVIRRRFDCNPGDTKKIGGLGDSGRLHVDNDHVQSGANSGRMFGAFNKQITGCNPRRRQLKPGNGQWQECIDRGSANSSGMPATIPMRSIALPRILSRLKMRRETAFRHRMPATFARLPDPAGRSQTWRSRLSPRVRAKVLLPPGQCPPSQ